MDNLAIGHLAPFGDWLRFCFTGLSNMPHCCAFPIALARLFLVRLMLYLQTFICCCQSRDVPAETGESSEPDESLAGKWLSHMKRILITQTYVYVQFRCIKFWHSTYHSNSSMFRSQVVTRNGTLLIFIYVQLSVSNVSMSYFACWYHDKQYFCSLEGWC